MVFYGFMVYTEFPKS